MNYNDNMEKIKKTEKKTFSGFKKIISSVLITCLGVMSPTIFSKLSVSSLIDSISSLAVGGLITPVISIGITAIGLISTIINTIKVKNNQKLLKKSMLYNDEIVKNLYEKNNTLEQENKELKNNLNNDKIVFNEVVNDKEMEKTFIEEREKQRQLDMSERNQQLDSIKRDNQEIQQDTPENKENDHVKGLIR